MVADDFRIRAALPTLEWLKGHGAHVTAVRIWVVPTGPSAPSGTWRQYEPACTRLCPGVELGENLRFEPGEKANDPDFVHKLTDGFDAYVNEAFGVAHRAHASVVGPPAFLPSAAGRQVAREVEVLGGILLDAKRPFVAVVGGAKVGDKLGVLRALARKVDALVVGGAMAFTFLAALGHDVGASIVDTTRIDECRRLLHSGVPVVLPVDVVALEPGGAFGACVEGPRGDTKVLGSDLPDGWSGLDIGPESADAFAGVIRGAGTVLWNGPMGAFEDDRFAAGTRRVAEAVAECPGFTVVGGGDSASALEHMGLVDRIDFLSTGGGASLRFIEHGDLPGLAALRAAPNAPGHVADRTA